MLLPLESDPDPSPIGMAALEASRASLRVQRPAVRRSWLRHGWGARPDLRGVDPYVEVPWGEALDLAGTALREVIATGGNRSIFGGSYGWASAGRFHHAQSQVHRFLNCLGGCVRSVDTYSLGAARVLMPYVVAPMDDLMNVHTSWDVLANHTKLFVAFGGVPAKNSQISQGLAAHHHVRGSLQGMSDAGVRFVNISPVNTDLDAGAPHEWIPIRPNTDTAMILALAFTLHAEGLHDRDFLASHCVGFDRFVPYLTGASDGVPKTPEWAEAITGVSASRIRSLARELAAVRSIVNMAWSLQRAHHGEQPYWALVTLAAALGQVGLPGGGFGFGFGSIGGIGNPRGAGSPTMPMGTNAGPKIPVARMADMLLAPNQEYDFNGKRERYPDVRLVYWAGGNPFPHPQDLNRLRQAWAKPEVVIVNDTCWTATARRADIVLPATTTLERNDVGAGARDRYIFAMEKAIDPVGGSRHDADIFRELAARLGYEERFTEKRDEMQWLRFIYENARSGNAKAGITLPEFDAFWAEGFVHQPAGKEFVMLGDFRADPQAHALKTPSGKIELYSERIASFGYDDCPPHAAWIPPREWLGADAARRFPLHLVTIQPPARLHGQMDSGPVSRASKVPGREPIPMKPADADQRSLKNGDVVRVFNERGECLAGSHVDPGTAQGVPVMATGSWYDPVDDTPLALERHGNPNVLAFDAGTSRLAQGPSPLSVLVEVEKWRGEAPAVRVFDPPETLAA